MLKNKLKNTSLFILLKTIKNDVDNKRIKNTLNQYENRYSLKNFQFNDFKSKILDYISSNKGEKVYEYKFANSRANYDLYSSVYALITFGLFNEIEKLNLQEKEEWIKYILSFQRENGLFIDNYLESLLADKIHYWGWYHLLPHLIIGLDYLGSKPKYDFKFLFDMFEKQQVEEWLKTRNWKENYLAVSNEVMNITLLLQYSRDTFNNQIAKEYVQRILNWLSVNMIDKKTSLWGYYTSRSNIDISKAVKTAYHFLPMYIYDNDLEKLNITNIINYTLMTQNNFGTYGPCCLTDGCEDIDSLYLLTQLPLNKAVKTKVDESVKTFFNSVFINMNQDGGFVFKRVQPFQYADSKLISNPDESNMFGTWFRTLSIAYACKYLDINNDFKFSNISGYQFYRKYK